MAHKGFWVSSWYYSIRFRYCAALFAGRLKNQLGEMIERLLPMVEVMSVFIHMPDVRNVLLLQVGVKALADADQAILIAIRDIEELQLPGSRRRVRHEFLRSFRVRRR